MLESLFMATSITRQTHLYSSLSLSALWIFTLLVVQFKGTQR